jgi:hypothetical protein
MDGFCGISSNFHNLYLAMMMTVVFNITELAVSPALEGGRETGIFRQGLECGVSTGEGDVRIAKTIHNLERNGAPN